MSHKPIICIDFDGVIHQYDSPWVDAVTISDGVVDGFFEWALSAQHAFRLVIYSSRSKVPAAVEAMRGWMAAQWEEWSTLDAIVNDKVKSMPAFEYASEKPAAFLTIDDRAMRFDGDWEAMDPRVLATFKPWNKRTEKSWRPPLSFEDLRRGNAGRLPQFKNSRGEPAHAVPDGSDWSPAQWLQAVVGELGEYANFRKKFERGDISHDEFMVEARKELADVACYLDLLAMQLGIDLGVAVREKFNAVSERVGSDVRI